MNLRRHGLLVLTVSVLVLIAPSCVKKEQRKEAAPADTTKPKELSYVSEEVNFGVYFDEAGTKRTTKLEKGQRELTIYLIVNFPEGMEIAAVQYRLVLPKGLEFGSDRAYQHIVAHIGTFEDGMSETFTCTRGPRLLLHTLHLNVTEELKNAEITIMPDLSNNFLGVALCAEGQQMIVASSYKAVVNPTE